MAADPVPSFHVALERGKALDWLNRRDEAFREYTRAISIAPGNRSGYHGRAEVRAKLTDRLWAVAGLTLATEISPTAESFELLGRALQENSSVQVVKDAIADLSADLPENLKPIAAHVNDFYQPLYNVWKQQEKSAGSSHFGNTEAPAHPCPPAAP